MESTVTACFLILISVAQAIALPYTATTTEFSLTPTETRGNFKSCTTKKGVQGMCVHESFCNDHYEIEPGGNIDDGELRSLECIKEVEWCCSEKNVTKTIPPATRDLEDRCKVSNRPDCPWCVLLYRDGNDVYRLDSGLFCMGTMIGSKVILTTATCMIQAHRQTLWARVPNSASPNTNHTIEHRLIHPKYNSGTRAYDLSLLVLKNEVNWGLDGSKGACIGINHALVGDCIGAGVDDNENLDTTPFLVEKGVCRSGSPVDASCGHLISEDCSVIPGSPIMCRVDNGPFVMVGMAKMKCLYDPPKSLLGNLNVAGGWLQDHFKRTVLLNEKNYLYIP